MFAVISYGTLSMQGLGASLTHTHTEKFFKNRCYKIKFGGTFAKVLLIKIFQV